MFRLSNKQFVRQNMAVFPCEPTTRVDVKRASSCGDRDQNRRRESNSVKRCDASRKVPASRGPSLDLDDSVPSRKLFKEIPRPLYYESLHSFVENSSPFLLDDAWFIPRSLLRYDPAKNQNEPICFLSWSAYLTSA